jgi:hypothetical protein
MRACVRACHSQAILVHERKCCPARGTRFQQPRAPVTGVAAAAAAAAAGARDLRHELASGGVPEDVKGAAAEPHELEKGQRLEIQDGKVDAIEERRREVGQQPPRQVRVDQEEGGARPDEDLIAPVDGGEAVEVLRQHAVDAAHLKLRARARLSRQR